GDLTLPHAVADHLAAAEFHFLAIGGEILFDFDDEIGVGEPHLVARRGPEHIGIDAPRDADRHATLLNRACPSGSDGNHRSSGFPRRPPARFRGSARARTAPPCRPRCRAAFRGLSPVRIAAPDWSRRNDNASRPGSAGRRYW